MEGKRRASRNRAAASAAAAEHLHFPFTEHLLFKRRRMNHWTWPAAVGGRGWKGGYLRRKQFVHFSTLHRRSQSNQASQ
jgi:hypothetical protein